MALRNTTLIIAGLLLLQPAFIAAQEQRPALVPLSQGSGAGASAASAASAGSIGGLSDGPISPGEVVHINVFDAPEFSLITRVSDSGDVPYPILGSFHIGGLNSSAAASTLAKQLKDRNLMVDPEVTVTVDSSSTGITILGEVHSPGIYPPPGKHELSDLIATAGGLTANTGRLIEITNDRNPGKKEYVSWENFGFVVAEAMACSAPVLVSDKVNIWREVKASGAGLVEADTLEGTRNLLRRFYALSETERVQMSRNAREGFLRYFDIEVTARDFARAIGFESDAQPLSTPDPAKEPVRLSRQ